MARYKTYRASDNKIVVVSRYAGKAVRGVAKCNPSDEFDAQKGEDLARLRCDKKIAEKRVARANAAYAEALAALAAAQERVNKMIEYRQDANLILDHIDYALTQMTSEM